MKLKTIKISSKLLMPLLTASLTSMLFTGAAFAKTFKMPKNGTDIVGDVWMLKPNQFRANDNFLTLSERYGIGFHELEEANPNANPWSANYGDIIMPNMYVLPSVRKGIVINLAELRLYYFPEGSGKVLTFPVGIGRKKWATPTITSSITHKMVNPQWNVPKSIKQEYAERGEQIESVIPAGPNNPLGKYAMRLGSGSYLIHGTNKKIGVGLRVSHGCIRLFNKDIKKLFNMVSINTPVTIVNEPYKLGTDGKTVFLEAHKPLSEYRDQYSYSPDKIKRNLFKLRGKFNIDWDTTEYVAQELRGIPAPIGKVRRGNPYL